VFAALHHPPTSGYEIENQDYHCDYKQKVNQAAANVKAEAEKPKNQHDYKYCPKHINPLSAAYVTETCVLFADSVTLHYSSICLSSADEPIDAQAADFMLAPTRFSRVE
jgi:hypothetical protein